MNNKSVRQVKDLRCLCSRCADDYRIAGYEIQYTASKFDVCDKCDRFGRTCVLMPKGVRNGRKVRNYKSAL